VEETPEKSLSVSVKQVRRRKVTINIVPNLKPTAGKEEDLKDIYYYEKHPSSISRPSRR
jgi:hypothetical protein